MARASADKVTDKVPGEKPTTESLSVHETLYLARDRLTILFDLWDEDRDGELSLAEFRNAMRMSGLRISEAVPKLTQTHSLISPTSTIHAGCLWKSSSTRSRPLL
jgi:hypothetical protein